MDDLSINFLKIFWQDFKTYNIWRDSSMQQDHASFNMEDALEDFKGFCTSVAAIGPLTSMLEDEQSFKHGGGDCYSKYYVA
jgi:hypothetical protein